MSSLKGVRTEMPRDDSRVVKVDHEADQRMASGQKKSGLGATVLGRAPHGTRQV